MEIKAHREPVVVGKNRRIFLYIHGPSNGNPLGELEPVQTR